MWTIIICAFICTALFFITTYFGNNQGKKFHNCLSSSFSGFLTGTILGFIIAIIMPAEIEKEVITEYNIEALQDNRTDEGSFFLGCGNIDGVMKFVFYYEENGFFKYKELNCNSVSIKYSNDKPKFQIIADVKKKNEVINNFSIIFPNLKYIIQVPKGSIKNDFSIDLQ